MTHEQNIDENGHVLTGLDAYKIAVSTPSAFIGGTDDARGDKDGSQSAFKLFTITGDVIVRVFGFCTVSLVGANATLKVGVAGNLAELITQSTGTDIDVNDIWLDATVDDVSADVFGDVKADTLIMGGADIIETVATADITAGNIRYVCLWRPVTIGSKVVGIAS